MANGVLQSHMATFDVEDNCSRNPLLCYLCAEVYEDPCILHCYHTFCAHCLRGRAVDNLMTCPLCGKKTKLDEKVVLPPTDDIMKFLVESSKDEKSVCANCEKESCPMFFCNTCLQPLCGVCREETHSAKMFKMHEITHLSKRTKEIHKICSIHEEPFIMFSTEKKCMLCINCFRDADIEGRSHCIDLETAWVKANRKLDESINSIQELQVSAREGIKTYRFLLEELRDYTAKEKEAISTLCSSMQEKLNETKASLLADVDKQYREKEELFKGSLSNLGIMLPLLHAYLSACTSFSSSANKFEFLSLAYLLMDRLDAIFKGSYTLHPAQGSQVSSQYREIFAKCLEPLLLKTFRMIEEEVNENDSTDCSSSFSSDLAKATSSHFSSSVLNGSMPHRNWRKLMRKVLEGSGPFAEHCRSFDQQYHQVYQNFHRLKDQVQELHRDVTIRRCLSNHHRISSIMEACIQMDAQLEQQRETLVSCQQTFEDDWSERCRQVSVEQEIYQSQLTEIVSFKQENYQMSLILKQLDPYIRSITSVMERIEPSVKKNLIENT